MEIYICKHYIFIYSIDAIIQFCYNVLKNNGKNEYHPIFKLILKIFMVLDNNRGGLCALAISRYKNYSTSELYQDIC